MAKLEVGSIIIVKYILLPVEKLCNMLRFITIHLHEILSTQ